MILVLGSNGFLGKRVCHKLKEKKIPYIGTSFSIGVDLREKEALNKGIPGTGLGLAIVKKLAQESEIQLSVTSKKNKGSIFRLEFPQSS